MALKIVLVNVPPLGVIEPWYDAPDFPRGSLACLAAFLLKNSPHEVKCIDAKYDRLSFEQTIEEILSFQPDIVGYTAFTNEIKPCAYVAARIKLVNPNIYNLIGGAHFTALPDKTLMEFPSFDGGIAGDGEESLLDFCNTYEAGADFSQVKGLVYRADGDIIMNAARPRLLDLNELPMPAWDLFRPAKHYWIQSTRGCPFNCHFCMNHNGRVARKRSVERTIEEMRFLIERFQPEWIRFGDELFSVDLERTALLLDEIAATGLGKRVKWDVQTHVKYVNKDLFRKFRLANVEQVDMGVESGDDAILKNMGKGTNLKMIKEAFRLAREEGVKTGSLLLIGQPNETRKTMLKTINLAVEINSNIPMFGIMVPFPGTEIARMAAKNEGGYSKLSTNWDDYRKQIGSAVEFGGITRSDIEILQFWGYLKVFIWNLRFIDLFKFLWKYKTEGFNVLKKILIRPKNLSELFNNIPKDYQQLLESQYHASYEDMIYSKEQFEVVQKNELRRTKLIKPELLKEQMPEREVKADEKAELTINI